MVENTQHIIADTLLKSAPQPEGVVLNINDVLTGYSEGGQDNADSALRLVLDGHGNTFVCFMQQDGMVGHE